VQRWAAWVAGAAAVAALAGVVGAWAGDVTLPWRLALADGSPESVILWQVRVPRVVLAWLVGLALGTSGSVLQALLRNPLADPFVLGVSGGAALGATVALALGTSLGTLAGFGGTATAALVGSTVATAAVLALAKFAGGSRTQATLLMGVIFNTFALSLISVVRSLAGPESLGSVVNYLSGSLGSETGVTLTAVAVLLIPAVLGQWLLSGRLNLLRLGDEEAHTHGVAVEKTRLVALLLASVAVAAAVSVSGLIGFVGLLVPHVARLVAGADSRLMVPLSGLLGATFLVLADALARASFSLVATELPVGVLTALMGAPVFVVLLLRRQAS
jgi:iron complex transport system permease protein